MKFSTKCLASFISSLSLFTTNLSFTLPAKASLPCEGGTINYYQNGSVESCLINNGVDVSIGTFAFPCKQSDYIYFDEKANFKSCVISAPVVIKRNNAIETCPKESRVDVSILIDGNQIISCRHGA